MFEEVTFRMGAGDRVGLVGKNGAGKSTMLKILAGDFKPDSGQIATEKEVRIGFLRQDIDFEQGRTVLEEAYQAFTDIQEVEKKLLRTESKLRSLAKQVLYVQELERKRIASELHDGIGQTLSAIKFYVENSISNLSDTTASSAITEFEKVVPKLQDAVDEVRRISMALRPSLLDDIGILATLHWFCRESNIGTPRINGNQKINFSFNNHNVVEGDISPNLKTEMFRIVQEAANNAIKYSQAKNIQIITKDEGKLLRLEVQDDGIGFDYAMTASKQGYAESKGMGLVSMRERVENSDGHFTVNSTPSKGTAIICLWPKGNYSFTDNRSGRMDRRKRF